MLNKYETNGSIDINCQRTRHSNKRMAEKFRYLIWEVVMCGI